MSGALPPSDPFSGMPPTDPAAAMMAQITDKSPVLDPTTGQSVPQPDRIERDPPQPDEARRRLVGKWSERVKSDKKHYERTYKRMRRNMDFVQGKQWGQDEGAFAGGASSGADEKRYVANVTLRHVQQRTASLYAANPEVVAKQRERMLSSVWDGDMTTLAQAQAQIQQATQQQALAAQQGMVPPPVPGQMPPGTEQAAAIIADFKDVQAYNKLLERVGKTLQLLWEYSVQEQTYPFKSMMKLTVRRAVVTGVGWVKLGFQRAMAMSPEIETRIADMVERLATIERLANDISDDKIPDDAGEAEQLRLAIQAMQQEPQIIVREGLLFDYPDSTSIVPDKKCKSLRGFLGADWVTQEYMMTPEEIQEVYGKDVSRSFKAYTVNERGEATSAGAAQADMFGDRDGRDSPDRGCVWEIYSRKDGLVYHVCDGYPDFLREPEAPDVYLDRFYPWFVVLLNEGYHERDIYPQSDVDLMRDMQMELNRARQGLREHRRANRPKTFTSAGVLEEDDKEKLRTHPANAIIELNALAPGQKIEDVLQPGKGPTIDPALYDTNSTFEDLLRVLGEDEASTGQTTSATATEAAVAQASRHTDLASNLDDQDDLLSELAQAAGKVLMLNVGADTVQRVVGPGAVWPELSKTDVVENIYLTIKAGSTGRPNKQQEVQNAQILFPMLQRVPGISPEWMARELIKRMDDRLDLTEAFIAGMPSMDAINRIQGTVAVPPPSDPINPVVSGQAPVPPADPRISQMPVPAAAGSPPAGGGRPGGPPGGASTGAPPGGGPTAPPMGGAPNDPTTQGPQGFQNAQAPPPTNGLLGPRTPPVPGANGLMPGRGGGPKLRPQGGQPTP